MGSLHPEYLYSNKFCYFKSILEVIDGVIIVGGSYKCDAICIWKYMEDDKPYCSNTQQKEEHERI